jgi:hypothetical protein
MTVSDLPYKSPLTLSFMASAAQMGYPIRDINGPEQTGPCSPKENKQHILIVPQYMPEEYTAVSREKQLHARVECPFGFPMQASCLFSRTYGRGRG